MSRFRTYHEVGGSSGKDVVDQVVAQQERIARRLERVACLVAVASGKGGVGKSALSANLAAALAHRGHRVGALDADLNGPSLARMLGVDGRSLVDRADGAEPPAGAAGVRVMSMELLQAQEDTPLRWKKAGGLTALWQGAAETGALREFVSDVAWGDLDFLVIDVPPGVDKIGRLLGLLPRLERLLLVTTPSRMAQRVVARSARLLESLGFEHGALVSNMTELVCDACGHAVPLWEDAERTASAIELPLWSRVPFDPRLAASTDDGRPWVLVEPESPAGRAITGLAERLEADLARGTEEDPR